MNDPQPLFDVNLRDLRRQRASRIGFADFLHEEAACIVRERLAEVNKTFTKSLVATGQRQVWQKLFPQASIIDDAEILEAEGNFDLAIHGLSAHAHNDPVGQFVQLRNLLKPDGLMIAVMFGGQTLYELRAALAEAEVKIRGGLSPRVSPMGEIRELGGLLGRAGLALPVADNITQTVTYETPLHLMRDLRAMGETNILAAQERNLLRRDLLMHASDIYTRAYSNDDGRVRATFEIVFLTGWAPSDKQQKPLRPGSAQARLADALSAEERPAGEKTGTD